MFKGAFRLLTLIVLLAGWALAAAAVHVVFSEQKLVILPKQRLGFEDTYVDVRKWTLDDAANHPVVVKRLLETGKTEALSHLKDKDSSGSLESQLKEALENPPTQPVEKAESLEQSVKRHVAKIDLVW